MARVITGAKAFVRLSGELVAFATGVSVTQEHRLEEIPQLDNLEVAEYAENGHRCSITLNSIKLASDATLGDRKIANSARFFGMDPEDDIRTLLLQPEMIIEIVESIDVKDAQGQVVDVQEAPIYLAEGCKFEGGSGQVDARGVWTGTWTFKCRRGRGI